LASRGSCQGLDPARGAEPIVLTPDFVNGIHQEGGTVLGTSRGPVDMSAAVEHLIRRGVNILFTIGGDGTQRGGHGCSASEQRGHVLSVVGIPKTVDNDVAFVYGRSATHCSPGSAKVLDRAHRRARCVQNGISLIS
jgi:6-phosphofructokinase 1